AASGWRLSPIVRVMSGSYVSVSTSTDRALDGTPSQKVNQVLANPYGNKTAGNYLNPAAFVLAPVGQEGKIGRNSIAGPGTWQFDIAVSRTFQVREQQKVEFRAEAFNVTNSYRMDASTLTGTLNSGNFGQVTAALAPSVMPF